MKKMTDIKVWIQQETCEEQMREQGRLGEDRKTWWGGKSTGNQGQRQSISSWPGLTKEYFNPVTLKSVNHAQSVFSNICSLHILVSYSVHVTHLMFTETLIIILKGLGLGTFCRKQNIHRLTLNLHGLKVMTVGSVP